MDIYDLRDYYAAAPIHSGRILWFDATGGEGMVQLDNGHLLYLHFSALHGLDKHRYAYPSDVDQGRLRGLGGKECMVLPYVSPGCSGCERVVVLDWCDRT